MSLPVRRTPHGPFERIYFSRTVQGPLPELPSIADVSVYRVGDILIDTGSSYCNEALIHALRDNPPTKILLTHQHEDHVGGVCALLDAFGDIPVYAPSTHVDIIQSVDHVPPHRELYWGHPCPPQNLIPYEAGASFETRGLTLSAVETPGHTPGHMCFTARWGKQLFACTGDLYFGSRHIPAWFESSAEDLIRSQRSVAALDKAVYMLPTHGKTRPDGSEVLNSSADRIEEDAHAVEKTRASLHEPLLDEISISHFKKDDPLGELTKGEISNLAFVRSVLEPVKSLPADSLAHFYHSA